MNNREKVWRVFLLVPKKLIFLVIGSIGKKPPEIWCSLKPINNHCNPLGLPLILGRCYRKESQTAYVAASPGRMGVLTFSSGGRRLHVIG